MPGAPRASPHLNLTTALRDGHSNLFYDRGKSPQARGQVPASVSEPEGRLGSVACVVHALPGAPDLETSLEAARGWDGTRRVSMQGDLCTCPFCHVGSSCPRETQLTVSITVLPSEAPLCTHVYIWKSQPKQHSFSACPFSFLPFLSYTSRDKGSRPGRPPGPARPRPLPFTGPDPHSHPAPRLRYPERLTPGDPSLGGLEPPCIPWLAPWAPGFQRVHTGCIRR